MEILVRITQDQSAAMLRTKDAAKRLLPALARAWGSAAQEVLGRAVKGRFTGKGPFPVNQHRLGIRTNRLRKAMRATAPQIDAASGNIHLSMGANVNYYGPHEFGFRGRVQVQGHTRKAVANGATFRGRQSRKTINDRKNSILIRGRRWSYSYVKPHSRKVNVPARRPLGTELDAVTTRLTFSQKIKAVMNRFLTTKS
jgi:hypothetical protein